MVSFKGSSVNFFLLLKNVLKLVDWIDLLRISLCLGFIHIRTKKSLIGKSSTKHLPATLTSSKGWRHDVSSTLASCHIASGPKLHQFSCLI